MSHDHSLWRPSVTVGQSDWLRTCSRLTSSTDECVSKAAVLQSSEETDSAVDTERSCGFSRDMKGYKRQKNGFKYRNRYKILDFHHVYNILDTVLKDTSS